MTSPSPRVAGLCRGLAPFESVSELAPSGCGLRLHVEVVELERVPPSYLNEKGWLAKAVRAHDRVVRRVFAQVPLVPLRFGALFAGRDELADELASPIKEI